MVEHAFITSRGPSGRDERISLTLEIKKKILFIIRENHSENSKYTKQLP